jgi:hypothetical protein
METNYKVIKLLNGTIVVGNVLFTPEDILIQYPLEVYTKPVHDESGKLVGEQMVLRPCLVMTRESEVVIDTYNVLYSSNLDDRLYESYEQMVKTVYKKKIYFEGNFYKDEGIKEDLTVEEAEYMKEVLDGLLDKDKTYH